MSRQKDILGAMPRGPDEKRNRELKQALTRTHFTFGDEPVVYERTNKLPDPTGHLEDYTGVLNTQVKKGSWFFLPQDTSIVILPFSYRPKLAVQAVSSFC